MNLALKRDFVHLRASELPKEVCKTVLGTGRERLIRSHSSARFSFELSGNSN